MSDHINIDKYKKFVNDAVRFFLEEDNELKSGNLLELFCHEQSISHRIALYLEKVLEKEDFFIENNIIVDCEYNRHLENQKKIVSTENYDDSSRRPDIVVHKRGTDEFNMIVIEIKKDKESDLDFEKLKAFTKDKVNENDYGYDLGISIHFKKREPILKYFIKGELKAK